MPTAISSYGAEISFSPKWWSYVSSTRIMVSSFCNVELANEELADKIAMTAQELLENAVKYAASAEENVRLRFAVKEDSSIRREVSNKADEAHIEGLKAHYAEITAAEPLAAYLQRMQRIAMDPEAAGSQLGLARIRYETGCELELHVDGPNVTMAVEFPLNKAAN